jgi:hypothetical protein
VLIIYAGMGCASSTMHQALLRHSVCSTSNHSDPHRWSL